MIKFSKEWLKGTHLLSGIDLQQEDILNSLGYREEVNVVLFTVDRKNYMAVENPDDGYRSYCQDIEECDRKPAYTFPDAKVEIITTNGTLNEGA